MTYVATKFIRCPLNQRRQMNSSTSRTNAEKLTQEQIKRQIAELQACLKPELEEDATNPRPKSPKRKALEEATILAPATPSPSEVQYCISRARLNGTVQRRRGSLTTNLPRNRFLVRSFRRFPNRIRHVPTPINPKIL